MVNLKRSSKPLTDEQVRAFWEVARTIVKAHRECEFSENVDYDRYESLLNQLHSCGLSVDEFREFAEVIDTANDECRSLK